jgi:hypothetical protein
MRNLFKFDFLSMVKLLLLNNLNRCCVSHLYLIAIDNYEMRHSTNIIYSVLFNFSNLESIEKHKSITLSSTRKTKDILLSVAQPGGRQMGNCPFHLEVCPSNFLLGSSCPLKFYFFKIV